MKKMLSVLCMMSLLVCSISSITTSAAEVDEPCTEIEVTRSEGLIYNCYLSVSNYNGSLCVNSFVSAYSTMQEIGIKDLTVEYSYNNKDWYVEWNAGDFLSYNATSHTLSNYIIAVEHPGCYYRVTGTHYAKASWLSSQSESHTSNSVKIG